MTPTAPTSALTDTRAALLRVAYTTPHPEYRRICTAGDTALAALAASDPEAAEQAAVAVRRHSPGLDHSQRALTEAQTLGVDTSSWEQRRTRLHDLYLASYRPGDGPVDQARGLLAHLTRHQPAVAAALIEVTRGLDDTWVQDFFQARTSDEVLTRTGSDRLPEVAPYDHDVEECWACGEAEGMCRYHSGQLAIWDWFHQIKNLLDTDPTARSIVENGLRGLELDPTDGFTWLRALTDEDIYRKLEARLAELSDANTDQPT